MKRIQEARKRKGLTQKELAGRLGLSTGAIQQYELGTRSPKAVQLGRIADALNCSVDWLMGRTDDLGEKSIINDWVMNRFMKAE